ncbi:MAG: mucoidy inhibitor MuiA family protein [Candidatus Thorarchaeota archaeon]|nr:mucoidy inhibitor MuiA family protein [Candidatus Thorarchaeota archaeon]
MANEISTQIKGVTVFRDGARITRTGKIKVKAGEQTILVDGITRYAQEDSFRVKGKGAASLKGIDVRQFSRSFEPEAELKEMLAELKKLESKYEVLASKITIQESRISNFNAVMSQFSSEFGKWFAAGESSMDRLSEMDDVGTKQLGEAKKKLRELEDESKKQRDKIETLRNNINRVQGERKTETVYQVDVLLDVKEASEVELEIVYQISYAGWTPTYDVDLQKEKASLKRIAMIRNNSLEDWSDIDLTVSTASSRPVRAVEANPYYVDVYSPTIGSVSTSSGYAFDDHEVMDMRKESEEEGMIDGLFEDPAPEIVETYAEASETLSGIVVYDVPGKVTLVAEVDPHPVTLQMEEYVSRKLHFWNAYAMPEVVAQDEITNGDSVLLPGGVKVYAEGDFIGETSIDLISPREKFRLGTRTAYDVKAEKKLVEKDTDKAGITRGKTKREYQYLLAIESFAKDAIEIRVVDRIPHSTSEKIEVELKEPSHVPKKKELGVLEWELGIERQKKLEITYSYEVEWEKDIRISPPLP